MLDVVGVIPEETGVFSADEEVIGVLASDVAWAESIACVVLDVVVEVVVES